VHVFDVRTTSKGTWVFRDQEVLGIQRASKFGSMKWKCSRYLPSKYSSPIYSGIEADIEQRHHTRSTFLRRSPLSGIRSRKRICEALCSLYKASIQSGTVLGLYRADTSRDLVIAYFATGADYHSELPLCREALRFSCLRCLNSSPKYLA
jgi:hypothetical protein